MPPVYCGFFDTRPKTSKDFAFGRDDVINELERLLNNGFWPVILGLKALVNMYMVKEVEHGIYEVVDGYMAKLVRECGI